MSFGERIGPTDLLIYLVIFVLVASSLGLVYLAPALMERMSGGGSGDVLAPAFMATDINGSRVDLSDNGTGVTLLEFMWLDENSCPACKVHNIEQFRELRKFANLTSVRIITVTYSRPTDAREMVSTYGITWSVISDTDQTLFSRYREQWSDSTGVSFYNPTLIIIDEDLRIHEVLRIPDTGVISEHRLQEDTQKVREGTTITDSGIRDSSVPAFLGFFMLGMITVLTPCSLILVASILAFIFSTDEGRGPLVPAGDGAGNESTSRGEGSSGNGHGRKRERSSAARSGKGSTRKAVLYGLRASMGFTIALSLVFCIVGLTAGWFGSLFYSVALANYIIGGLFILLGVNLIAGIIDRIHSTLTARSDSNSMLMGLADRLKRISGSHPLVGGLFVGLLFSMGWGPCAVSMVLPMILMAIKDGDILLSGAYLLIFGFGHALPIVPLIVSTSVVRTKLTSLLVRFGKGVNIIFGALLVLFGIYFIVDAFM